MQVQPSLYYAIKAESFGIMISKQNEKPFSKQSAYLNLAILHESASQKNAGIFGIQKFSEIKHIANDIFKGYEQKMGYWGCLWDDFKQLFGFKTERKQLMTLRDEILEHVFNRFSKQNLLSIQQNLCKLEQDVQSLGLLTNIHSKEPGALPSLSQIQSQIEEMKISESETYFKVITYLTENFNALYEAIYSAMLQESEFNELNAECLSFKHPIYSLCAKAGKHYLRTNQLDQAFHAFQLICNIDSKRQGYLILINKYLEKNQTDQAFEVAQKLIELQSDLAIEPLKKIHAQLVSNCNNTQAEKVNAKLVEVQQLNSVRKYFENGTV